MLLWLVILVLALTLASFANVVIFRLPQQMHQSWRQECTEYLEQHKSLPEHQVSLLHPMRSVCPHCQHSIQGRHNIPLLSYLLLRGKCAYCKAAISSRYFWVECLGAALIVASIAVFGLSVGTGLIAAFMLISLILTMIDLKHMLLPDSLVFILLWMGIIYNIDGGFVSIDQAIYGVVAGYGVLWLISVIYQKMTGKYGLGGGDMKLLAALGAWLGIFNLPTILIISSICALVVIIPIRLYRKQQLADNPFPFGPFLLLAGIILVFSTKYLPI